MSKEHMKKAKTFSRRRMKTEIRALRRMSDKDIDLSDIAEVRDWSKAERGKFYRPVKHAVSLRLDADVLAWFRVQNEKYQTKINAVLREFMQQHRR